MFEYQCINSNKMVERELVAVTTHNPDLIYPFRINAGTSDKRWNPG